MTVMVGVKGALTEWEEKSSLFYVQSYHFFFFGVKLGDESGCLVEKILGFRIRRCLVTSMIISLCRDLKLLHIHCALAMSFPMLGHPAGSRYLSSDANTAAILRNFERIFPALGRPKGLVINMLTHFR